FLTRKSGNDRCGRLQSSLLRADTLALHTCGVTRRTERKKGTPVKLRGCRVPERCFRDEVGTLQAMRAVTLRNVFAYVLSQHFVDQRLVSDAATARFLAELIEHARIDTDRDQLARF